MVKEIGDILALQVINVTCCLISNMEGLFDDEELQEIYLYNLDGYLSTVEDLVQADPASIVPLRLITVIWRALLPPTMRFLSSRA